MNLTTSTTGQAERGTAVIIAFVLLAAIISAWWLGYQIQVAPEIAKDREIGAEKQLTAEMETVGKTVTSVAFDDEMQSVTVGGTVNYPLFAQVKSNPKYTINVRPYNITVETGKQSIKGNGNGKKDVQSQYSTFYLDIHPDYNYYTANRHFKYAHGTAYTTSPGEQNIELYRQDLIDGKQITLTLLRGYETHYATQQATNIQFHTVKQMNRTTIEARAGKGVVFVTIPTEFSQSYWEQRLKEERTGNGGHVSQIEYQTRDGRPNRVTIKLEGGVEYSMRTAHVAVRTPADTNK